MILQAFDFFNYLKRKCFANWWVRSVGNIVNGVELIRKLTNQSSLD